MVLSSKGAVAVSRGRALVRRTPCPTLRTPSSLHLRSHRVVSAPAQAAGRGGGQGARRQPPAWERQGAQQQPTWERQDRQQSGLQQEQQLPRPEPRYRSQLPGCVMRIAEHTSPTAVAAAIHHQLSRHSKVLLLAVGANAVYNAIRAVAAARSMQITDCSRDIAMQPMLQPNPADIRRRHTIRIYLYSTPMRDLPGHEGEQVLRVGPVTDPNRLAGSICQVLQAGGSCRPTAAGAVCTYRAIRGMAVARFVLMREHEPGEPVPRYQQQRQQHDTDDGAASGASPTQAADTADGPRRRAVIRGPGTPSMDLMAFPRWEAVPSSGGVTLQVLGISVLACKIGFLEEGLAQAGSLGAWDSPSANALDGGDDGDGDDRHDDADADVLVFPRT